MPPISKCTIDTSPASVYNRGKTLRNAADNGGYPMELLDNLPEEEESQITLTGEDGEEITFDYLDCLTYQDTEYLVLMPTDTEETQIVILEIQPVDEENETYLPVEDEAALDAVYGLFKEKYKDILTFED